MKKTKLRKPLHVVIPPLGDAKATLTHTTDVQCGPDEFEERYFGETETGVGVEVTPDQFEVAPKPPPKTVTISGPTGDRVRVGSNAHGLAFLAIGIPLDDVATMFPNARAAREIAAALTEQADYLDSLGS